MWHIRRFFAQFSLSLVSLNILHIFNDGFQASFILLLPFIVADLKIDLFQVGTLGTHS